jgi:DNA-directed RNA polymerase specialized sigma24 family protein
MYRRAQFKLRGNVHTAQDVVQACMIEISKERVFNILMNVEEKVKRTYIISMVDNCIIDYYRDQHMYKLAPIEDLKKYEDKSNASKNDVLKM